jgi:hypothetical protein
VEAHYAATMAEFQGLLQAVERSDEGWEFAVEVSICKELA